MVVDLVVDIMRCLRRGTEQHIPSSLVLPRQLYPQTRRLGSLRQPEGPAKCKDCKIRDMPALLSTHSSVHNV